MKSSTTTRIAPRRRILAAAAAALLLAGCGEKPDSPLASGPEEGEETAPRGLVVSEARGAAGAASSNAPADAEHGIAYVSLAPGTLLDAVSVRIRNVTTGAPPTPSIPVVDGGFDPVAVPARTGDRLELAMLDGGGEVSHLYVSVPPRRPPVVVRTNPPRGRTDVALNARPRVIFSEPVDPGTLAAGVRLLRGGAEVAASVALHPDDPWSAELVPADALEPETTYELQIATAVTDLDGEALGETVTVTFTTESRSVTTTPTVAIAFVSDRDGAPHIYVADPDGSNVRRLAAGQEPAWSWDGRRIAFVRGDQIYVLNHDGTELTYVGPGRTPAWSPDGRIAFSLSLSSPPSYGLYVMNGDGSGVTELLGPSWLCTFSADCAHSQIFYPAWSPDGQSIAFHAYIGGSSSRGVGIVGADGSDPRLLQELLDLQVEGFFQTSSGVNTRAAWSPDGSTIAVITGNPWLLASYPYRVYTYEIASADLALVHTAPSLGPGGAANDPAWTADATEIAFAAASREGDPRQHRRVFTVSLETGVVRQLIPDAIDPVAADYSDWGAVWSRANR